MRTEAPPSFDAMVGTGGVGSGIIYRLVGNHDLGRNETRMAHRVPQRDFCKLHIILHYVAVLAGDLGMKLAVHPVGAVGNDPVGRELLATMRAAGMNLRFMRALDGTGTLFAVCYQFPDHTGGNITEADNASDKVTPGLVSAAFPLIRKLGNRCMVLAAPEVPLATRATLLEEARRRGAFTVASFVSGEMTSVRKDKLLRLVDLLSVNIDEAALLGDRSRRGRPADVARACAAAVRRLNPRMRLTVTHGGQGAWAWHADRFSFLPALKVPVANTAGAGDAWLAGLMLGLARGLPFADTAKGATCVRLARLLSALSVTSPDTIHFGINVPTLAAFARTQNEPGLARWLKRAPATTR